jgi:regulator of replication initiation timing
MSELEFQKLLIQQYAFIQSSLESINKHLEKLNGRVLKLESENFARQLEIQKLQDTKSDVERVQALEEFQTEVTVRGKDVSKIFDFLKPLIYVMLGVAGSLLGQHLLKLPKL